METARLQNMLHKGGLLALSSLHSFCIKDVSAVNKIIFIQGQHTDIDVPDRNSRQSQGGSQC